MNCLKKRISQTLGEVLSYMSILEVLILGGIFNT